MNPHMDLSEDELDRRQREFDRRKFRRDDLITLARVRPADADTEAAFQAEAENISRMGLLLTCGRDAIAGLAPGDRLRVNLPAQTPGTSVEVAGRIRWSKLADTSRADVHPPEGVEGKAAQIGLQFEDVPVETYKQLAPDRIEDD